MKIRIVKQNVEIIPESPAETAQLHALWIKMGNGAEAGKNLIPAGEYNPKKDESASFTIEGLSDAEIKDIPVVIAPFAAKVRCPICGRVQFIQKGDPIPACCNTLMEIVGEAL